MNNKEITIKPIVVKEIAQKIENNYSQTPYEDINMTKKISGPNGSLSEVAFEKVYNAIFDLNSETRSCVIITKGVMECTSRLLKKAAVYFKDVDEALAKEVSEG